MNDQYIEVNGILTCVDCGAIVENGKVEHGPECEGGGGTVWDDFPIYPEEQ